MGRLGWLAAPTPRPSPAEWVEETCARQGVPVKIADPRVLADIGSLLGYAQVPPSARARARKRQTRQSGVTRVGSK